MLPLKTTTIGLDEALKIDSPFHNMKAVDKTCGCLLTLHLGRGATGVSYEGKIEHLGHRLAHIGDAGGERR